MISQIPCLLPGGGIFLLCDHPGTSGNVYILIYGTGLMTQTFLLWVQFPAHLLFQGIRGKQQCPPKREFPECSSGQDDPLTEHLSSSLLALLI